MSKCDSCDEQCQLPFHCTYCGGSFCSDHRLPPTHNCPNEAGWRKRTSQPAGDVQPKEEIPSRSLTECYYCGVKTSKFFYCPLCGHEFCSVHKRHQDHYSDPHRKNEQQKPNNSSTGEKPSLPVIGVQIVVALLVLAAIIVGVDWVFGIHILPSVSDSGIVGTSLQQQIPVTTPHNVVTPLPTTTRIIYPRPMTGAIILGNQMIGGNGDLTIDNLQGGSDAIAVLTTYGRKNSLTSIYIRSGEIYTIEKIADGNYDLYIQYGANWNPVEKKFEDNPRYSKFDDAFPYITTETTTETDVKIITHIKYTTWKVTLYNVVDGNANTEELSEESFPEL